MVHRFILRREQVPTFEAIQRMIAFATLVLLLIDSKDQKITI